VDRITVVINFDKHWDYAPAQPSVITCAKWGYFAVYPGVDANEKPLERTALADSYVQFGGRENNLAYAVWHPGGLSPKAQERHPGFSAYAEKSGQRTAPTPQQALSNDPGSITAQIQRIRESIPPGATGWNAYVTCDRDFMKRNFTPWGDGYFDPDVGIAGIVECLQALRAQRFNLIGFDITGLPDVNGTTASKATFTKTDAADLADQQIVTLWKAASEFIAA
jgi:hypothetical protein